MVTLLTVLALLLAPALARAESPMERAQALISNYQKDLTRVDQARDILTESLKTDSRVEAMILLSRIHFIWGDVRAKSKEEKLDAYDRGRKLGERAVELAPKDPEAHFWYATNTGRWGQTKGVLRSLFLLPTVEEELETIFSLAPEHAGAHVLAGNVKYEVPRFFGGGVKKAEEHFSKALEIDPKFTAARVGLARVLIKKKKYENAREELQRVLDEKEPRNLAAWTVKHAPRARKLLESIKDKTS
ncbi:MAG: tetratricopeptide repeat protein [Candidatus Methylomirabilia bacterium]